jgi:uncharacterized protein YciI
LSNTHPRSVSDAFHEDDAGALWLLDADTAEAAEEIVKRDPIVNAGIFTSWLIRPIADWSAQEAKGSR